MTVRDVTELFIDDCTIEVYSISKDDVIYSGSSDWTDMPDEIANAEIMSIDCPAYSRIFTFNID